MGPTQADGRAYVGAFPAKLVVLREGHTWRVVIRPFDDRVGARWEVRLDADSLGSWLVGVEVVRPVDVFQAPAP
jgi:hypothetical protein